MQKARHKRKENPQYVIFSFKHKQLRIIYASGQLALSVNLGSTNELDSTEGP